MPKNVFSKREDFICGKIEFLIEEIKSKITDVTDKISFIEQLHEIQHDAQKMENKLIFRKQEAKELKAEIRNLNCYL
jgi:hypothetical protein